MADDNDVKPSRSAADKEKSRQQSRPISGKEAAKGVAGQPARAQKTAGKPTQAKGGQQKGASTKARPQKSATGTGAGRNGQNRRSATTSGKGGQRPARPKGAVASTRPPRRSPTALLTWGVVVLVLIVVIVLVVVKLTSSSPTASGPTGFVKSTPSVVSDVTNIPASVYNDVGITSSDVPVSPPTIVKGQPPLTINGQPGLFYFGAEYCPYCAAERWAMIASMSRFGTWTNLGDMVSSPTDVFPSTQTFTFAKAKFSSPYLAAQTVEFYSNQPTAAGGYTLLQPLTKAQRALVTTYDSTKYFPGTQSGSFPFIDIGNKALVAGASFSPSILQGLSRTQIASALNDPKDPVTQAIIATSNYLSAATCNTNGMKPASVCNSKGVTTAAKKLGFS
jgi:hypothetical protein